MEFTGKVCVVTGASSGIGRQIAVDLAARGARVCAVARREERLEALVGSIGGTEAGHSWFAADVSDRAAVDALVDHVRATYGRIDLLVNNAGFSRPGDLTDERSVEVIHEVMATNFFGPVYCTKAFLGLLLDAAPSHVINVASVAGRLALGGSSAYSASKFALVGWSEALNLELEERGVHIGLVEPGPVPTEGFPQEALKNDRYLRWTLASPEDVSEAVMSSIAGGKVQRTVPRWYYLLQIPRLLAPPLFRAAQKRIVKPRGRAE